jgi:2-octaprenyl-6-methoxyphenol hydroxylase
MNQKIAIIGAGLSGLIAGIAFAQYNIPVRIFEKSRDVEISKDPRTTSLNFKSVAILKKYNIWQQLQNFVSPIEDIYVIDNYATEMLHFCGNDVLDKNSKMGYIIENNILRDQLRKIAHNIDSIEFNYEADLSFSESEKISLHHNSIEHNPDLIIACDGKFSSIREQFFSNMLEKSYEQQAVVFNIWHEKPHNNIAVEHFMNRGPFAILPLKDPNMSSIVWSEKEASANLYIKMSAQELLLYVQEKMGSYLGDVKIISDVSSYPLSAHITKEYYYKNIVLVADSAHSIHPLAGQGLNIGIQDVESLVEIAMRSLNVGLNINETILEKYSRQRFWANLIMFNAMDILNLVFSNNSKIVAKCRRIGMSVINKLPIVKGFFMKKAMGT